MTRAKPAMSADTAFFWEGAERGELLIQRCTDCKTLRHPPGPGCPSCGSLDWDTVEASGRGTVHSYAVHHYPPIPGNDVPNVVALVDVEEGVRILANLTGVEPDAVEIDMPVEVYFEDFGPQTERVTLPQWRPLR
jgi:uncharacterized OB-fold protein